MSLICKRHISAKCNKVKCSKIRYACTLWLLCVTSNLHLSSCLGRSLPWAQMGLLTSPSYWFTSSLTPAFLALCPSPGQALVLSFLWASPWPWNSGQGLGQSQGELVPLLSLSRPVPRRLTCGEPAILRPAPKMFLAWPTFWSATQATLRQVSMRTAEGGWEEPLQPSAG